MDKYLLLAFKNIRRRGLRSWLTMLGIFIGIAAVVSLISLGSGLREAVTGQFSSMGTDKLTVTNAQAGFGPPGSTAIKKLNQHDIDLIKSVPGVDEVIPRLIRTASIEYNKISGYYYLGSLPKDQKQTDLVYNIMNIKVMEGQIIGTNDRGKVVLGHDFTKESKFKKTISVGSTLKIQGKDFKVAGILEPASSFQVNMIALMNEKDMEEILGFKDEADLIAVVVSSDSNIEDVGKAIEDKLRKDRNEKEGEEDFTVQTPLQALQGVSTILDIINLIVIGIALVSLIVGGIGIANTMYTSVLERFREIGVMKAIGARNSDVLKIFVYEAGLLGLIGGFIGVLMGLGIAFGMAAAANSALGERLFAVQISMPLILGSLSFSLLIGIVSGVFPAIQASKLKPVEALRS